MEEDLESLTSSASSEEDLEIPEYRLPVSLPSTSNLELPVGGRLKHFVPQWEEMGANPFILKVLRKGYKIPFKEEVVLTLEPCMESKSSNPVKDQLIEDQFQDLVEKRVLEVVPGPTYSPGFYSIIFTVPKPNGKHRPVIDLKRLNKSVDCPHFKMDDVQTVWQSLLPDHYAFSIDLKDAYLHVPIHKSSRKFLRVFRNGVVYQFRALPFGLSTAPLIFTKIVAEIKEMVHVQGINMHSFLDDWLHMVKSKSLAKVQAGYMVKLSRSLGWIVNLEKSDLRPVRQFKFIGVWWDLLNNRVFPTQQNRQKVLSVIHTFLSSDRQMARKWLCVQGCLTAQQRYVHLGRLYARAPQWALMRKWKQSVDPLWYNVMITPEVRASLQWWRRQLQHPLGVPLVEPPYDVHIFTDASTTGWGGVAPSHTYKGLWNPEETSLSINVLELRAIINTLDRMVYPPSTRILVASDNTTAVAYLNHQGGTHSWNLMRETYHLYQIIQERKWFVRARHIPGKFNVEADQLSRSKQDLPTEWSLHPKVAQQIFDMWFQPDVDLFATKYNNKCFKYVAPGPSEGAIAVDGLSFNLEGLEAYAYPPQQILMKLLQKFRMTSKCRLIVIAPNNPKQPWYPVLHELAVVEPFQLPHIRTLLKQPMRFSFYQYPEQLDLHAFWLENGFW